MATIFLSFSMRDKPLASEIAQRLKARNHTFHIDVDTPPAGKWREKLINALRTSDVLIPLLTENGLKSNYVSSEIGSARILGEIRDMLLLPVVIGVPFKVPSYVGDYHCFRLPEDPSKNVDTPGELDRLVDELDFAIKQYVDSGPKKTPAIFISHRHSDTDLAEAVIRLIEAAFEIVTEDIRCTSVPPYTLSPGEKSSDRLRAEINAAHVVLGLLSPDTQDSKYVLAELGAAWGAEVPTFPLLIRGAKYEHVPEPLNELSCLELSKSANCTQLVEAIANVTALKRRRDDNALTRITAAVDALATLARGDTGAGTGA